MPAEYEIDCGVCPGCDFAAYFPGVVHEKDKRYVPAAFLQLGGERKYVLVNVIVHADNHVNVRLLRKNFPGIVGRFRPFECRRIGHVKAHVLLVYLGLDLSVLFHDEGVIIAAYHQYPPDSELDK